MLTIVLSVIALLLLVIAFIYTMKIGKNARYQSNGNDSDGHEQSHKHPYLGIRNPIFLTYLIAALLVISFIVYYASTSKW